MALNTSDQQDADDAVRREVFLRVIGMVDLSVDGASVESLVKRRKPLALFAYLALANSDKFFQREHLCDVFWPESTQRRARASLRQALALIRRALPEVLELLGTEAVRLSPGSVRTDVTDFLDAVDRADWPAAEALSSGELFEGFHVPGADRFEDWLDGLRATVREARRKQPVAAPGPRRDVSHVSGTPSRPLDPPRRPSRVRLARSRSRAAFAAFAAAILFMLALQDPFARGGTAPPLQPLVVLYPFQSETEADSAGALGAFIRDAVALELRRRLAGVTVAAIDDEGDIRRSDAIYVTGLLRSGRGQGQLNLRLSELNGEVIRLLGPVASDPMAPRAAAARLADEISVVAADRFRNINRARATALEDTDLPPWEAYVAFARSREHAARNRWSLALPEAERAVELAPDWTEARLEWATHLANNRKMARADSVLTSVLRGGTLGPFQRARADWLVAAMNNDRTGRLRAHRKRLELDGRRASIQLVYELLGLGRPEEALEAASLLDRDEMVRREVFRYWTFPALAHHALGNHEAELSVARDGLELFPERPVLVQREVAALAAMGRVSEVLDWVERAASTFATCCPLQIALVAGDELAHHGWKDAAALAYARGYELSHRPQYWEERDAEVLVLLRMERWKEAKSRLEPLLDDSSNRARDLGSMGVIAAGLREPAEAREWMTRLEPSRFQGLQRAEALLSQARIAAALGMDESALKFLRTASTNGLASGQGTHDPIFEKLRTHEQFVTWATPRELLDSR